MNNEYNKQWYHIQDTMKHKLKIQELFIKYINNCITEDKDKEIIVNEDSLLYMIMNRDDCFNKSTDSLIRTLLINSFVQYKNTFAYEDEKTIKITNLVHRLSERIINHDDSKIEYLPEFNLYKDVSYQLNKVEFGSEEYNKLRPLLDEGFEIHGRNNRHHPEHFQLEGVRGMNMYDIIEMVLDWCAAALARGYQFKLSTIYKRIDTQNFSKELCDTLTKNIYLILDKDQIINDLE